MEIFGQNLRHALRQLRRNPGFALTVIVTLALSIGANTAIFSLVNALMLKALPYAHPERLGTIFTHATGSAPYDERHSLDGEQWELLRDNVPALRSAISSGTAAGVNLETATHVQYVHAGRVSAHYFDVLDIQPVVGRGFTEAEDRPKGPPEAILSYGLWRTAFGMDRNLIGQTIHLKGEPYSVIGILPQDAVAPLNADLYTALQPTRTGEGGGSNFDVIARLRDGATWQEANAEINRAWAAWATRFAQRNPGEKRTFYTVPLQQGQAAELRPKALALMMAAGFILLIACANLAGLTLVRMARRAPEISTRLALGAAPWQIQRQLWVENLALAAVGGGVGIGAGYLALHGLLLLLPMDYLPVANVPLDHRVLAFTVAVTLLTSVLFGMLPALSIRKASLRSFLGSRAMTGRDKLHLRRFLIAGEVALTVVLLAASGLLIRTLVHLETLPPGFNPNGVMTAKASLDDARFRDPAAFQRLLDESVVAMRRIPGVTNAAVGLTLPFERTLNDSVLLHGGPDIGQHEQADVVYVTPGYFETLQLPLLAGRTFSNSDGPHTQSVAVINRTFARKFFPGINPIGQSLDKSTVIIGVVGDVQLSSGLNPIAPLMTEETMYIPAAQVEPSLLSLVHVWFQPSWIVRTASPVSGLTEQMQQALADVEPGLPFSGFYGMNARMAQTLATQRVEVALLGAMAGLALLLSAVGVFALVASIVTQRTREIGIRMALGSSVRQAMLHVAGSGARASLAGLVLGLVLSLGALRIMRSVLYGVGIYDAVTIFSVVLTLLLITFAATIVPARRIARIDPARTLRDE